MNLNGELFGALMVYADQLEKEIAHALEAEHGLADDLGKVETFSQSAYQHLRGHLADAKRGGVNVDGMEQRLTECRAAHETNARRVWEKRNADADDRAQAFAVLREGLAQEKRAVIDFAATVSPRGLLCVTRNNLQRYYDAIYPMDGESGERKRLTLGADDFEADGDNLATIADIPAYPVSRGVGRVLPDGGDELDARWFALFEAREELGKRCGELVRAHEQRKSAKVREAKRGEIDAAYSKILRLVENDLGYLNGLLTKIEADAAASGTAAADAPLVANPAPSASVGGSAAATGAAATATPSVILEQVAQGVTKRMILNGVTDTQKAQAVQAFAQGGAQVAPQIATTRKRGHHGIGIATDDAAKKVIKAAMIHKRDNPDMKNPDVIQWLLIKGSKNVKLRILQDRNHTAIDPNSELGKDLYSYYGYDRKKQTGKTPLKMGGMVFDIGKICTKWGSFMSAVKRSKEKKALVQIGESEPKLTYSPLKSISNHKRHKRT